MRKKEKREKKRKEKNITENRENVRKYVKIRAFYIDIFKKIS